MPTTEEDLEDLGLLDILLRFCSPFSMGNLQKMLPTLHHSSPISTHNRHPSTKQLKFKRQWNPPLAQMPESLLFCMACPLLGLSFSSHCPASSGGLLESILQLREVILSLCKFHCHVCCHHQAMHIPKLPTFTWKQMMHINRAGHTRVISQLR
ncbi:hypothetical protein K438DRAFT_1668032 [Mycena galopus ATCC 62051]|nr:hypothetical protein K438DRAFT_1668032 [Mycena galopus ATCC 62051]